MFRFVLALALLLTPALLHAAADVKDKVLQRLPIGPYDYVLMARGNVYADNGLFRKQIDDGTGTIQLAGTQNNLFILKKDSQIWWFDGKIWTLLDEGENTTRIDFVDGHCEAYKQGGEAWRCTLGKDAAGKIVANWDRVVAKRPVRPVQPTARLQGGREPARQDPSATVAAPTK